MDTRATPRTPGCRSSRSDSPACVGTRGLVTAGAHPSSPQRPSRTEQAGALAGDDERTTQAPTQRKEQRAMATTTDPQVILASLLARLSGPGEFRFVWQPLVAVLLGVRDGMNDAKAGRPPYIWGLFFNAAERRAMLQQGT